MVLHRTKVPQEYEIDFGDPQFYSKIRQGDADMYCRPLIARWVDRVINPAQNVGLTNPNDYLGLRSYRFPGPIDRFSIYLNFVRLESVPNFPLPTLHWRIQLGVGPIGERFVEGFYTPEGPNETGLLVSVCTGRLFNVIEFATRVEDQAPPNSKNEKRACMFVLSGFAQLGTTCLPITQTGENGTITWIAQPTVPTTIVIP